QKMLLLRSLEMQRNPIRRPPSESTHSIRGLEGIEAILPLLLPFMGVSRASWALLVVQKSHSGKFGVGE
ncbi:MAG TPA: hypothetical protein VGK96_06710, partial [Candidatus Sulfotelmatobacter sp.]